MITLLVVFSILTNVDPGWIALAASVLGGVGLKLAESWLGRNKVKIDDAKQIRDELRAEVTSLREEGRILEADVTKWREAYYELREKGIGKSPIMKEDDNVP